VVEVDEERAPAVKVEADGMDVDGPVASSSRLPTPPPAVENYVDDDELQSALARQRRQKSRKTAKLSPEEIARQRASAALHHLRFSVRSEASPTDFRSHFFFFAVAEQKAEEEASAAVARASQAAAAKVEEDDDQIQFNETSTFARAVQMPPVVQVIRTSAAEPVNAVASSSRVKTEATDVNLDSLMAQDQDVKMEDDDEPEEEVDEQLAEMALRQGLSIEEMRIKLDADLAKAEQEDDVEVSGRRARSSPDFHADRERRLLLPRQIGTASEAVVGKGLAGALALLKSTGNLDTNAPADARERERIQKEKDLWLADRRRRLAQRELERIQARGGNKDQATLEYDKRMREQREAADAVEAFRNYKPDVNIVYHDEFGREMTPKEAWKALSHRFQCVPPSFCYWSHSLLLTDPHPPILAAARALERVRRRRGSRRSSSRKSARPCRWGTPA
jgi:U4/U6.U5 tri-snRNP-associated protein 1